MKIFILLFFIVTLNIYFSNGIDPCKACLKIRLKLHYDLKSILRLKPNVKKADLFKNIVNVMKKVENLFFRPFMTLPVCIEVLSHKYVWSVAGLLRNEDSGSYTVENYCKWQLTRKSASETSYSILFTGLNLYSITELERYVLQGICYQGGHCTPDMSCATLQYSNDLEDLANTLAHELAHSIGAEHDERAVFIMYGNRTLNQKVPSLWSEESRESIVEFLRSDSESSCFGNSTERNTLINQYLTPQRESIEDCRCKCAIQ